MAADAAKSTDITISRRGLTIPLSVLLGLVLGVGGLRLSDTSESATAAEKAAQAAAQTAVATIAKDVQRVQVDVKALAERVEHFNAAVAIVTSFQGSLQRIEKDVDALQVESKQTRERVAGLEASERRDQIRKDGGS